MRARRFFVVLVDHGPTIRLFVAGETKHTTLWERNITCARRFGCEDAAIRFATSPMKSEYGDAGRLSIRTIKIRDGLVTLGAEVWPERTESVVDVIGTLV